MLKRLYQTGFAAYFIMFILSLVFYKERTIFLDTAFNLFYIINKRGFAIQIYRFGDLITQLLPHLAVKAGMPLDIVLQLYSVSFVLFYSCLYFICGSLLKRYDFALIILLVNILFVSDTFYWMLSQLPQAVAILMTVFALASRKPVRPVSAIIIAVALVTVVFFHPLILFVMGFSLLFFMLGNYSIVDKKLCFSIAAVYAAGMIIKFFIFKTPYEAHSMSGLKNFIRLFPDYITLFSNRRLLHNCLTKYYWMPALFVVSVFYYFKIKDWRKLGLLVVSFAGYLLLVNVCYPFPVTPEFYIENLYIPLAVFIALPLVFDVAPAIKNTNITVTVFLLILVSAGIRFYTSHTVYTARLDYERQLLNEYGDRKVIINATQKDKDVLLMIWGTPYEFLLLSESERQKPASIIIDDTPELRFWSGSQKQTFVVNYNLIPYSELNHHYFQVPDTTSIYTILHNR